MFHRIVSSLAPRTSPLAAAALALTCAAVAGAAGKPAAPTAPSRPATPPATTKPTAPPAAKPADPPQGGAAAEAAAMEAWSKYMTPGIEHAKLLTWVGDWELDVAHTPMPGAPTSTSKATATIEPLLGGRYLHERVRGDFGGMPFEGIGTTGFDNVLKRFVSAWIDSMGTGIMTSSGTASPDGKTITMSGKMVDPMAGKEVPFRQVITMVDNNTRRFEMFNPGPDGKEFKAMEITYKRKGGAATTPAAPPAAPPATRPAAPAGGAPAAPAAPSRPAGQK